MKIIATSKNISAVPGKFYLRVIFLWSSVKFTQWLANICNIYNWKYYTKFCKIYTSLVEFTQSLVKYTQSFVKCTQSSIKYTQSSVKCTENYVKCAKLSKIHEIL